MGVKGDDKGRKTRQRITAAELLAQLNADPAFLEAQRLAEARREVEFRAWSEAERPLVAELRRAGVQVDSAWDLVNTYEPYPAALPILLRHLQMSYPARLKEGMARAIAVPAARFAWETLVQLYKDESERDAKDGLAVALSNIADAELVPQMIELLREPANGSSRVLLLSVLEDNPTPEARAALTELAADPQLSREIAVMELRLCTSRKPPGR